MSESTPKNSFIFNTDLGNMLVNVESVTGYDVEDVVADKAFSQAQIVRFERIADNADINALRGARTISSVFLEDAT